MSHEGSDSVKQSGLAWLGSRACLWTGGQDLAIGSPAVPQWNGGGVGPQKKGLLWSELGGKRCWRRKSEALQPRILPIGPSPGLPENTHLSFPALPLLSVLFSSLPQTFVECCSVSGTLLDPGEKKKMSQTQGRPWEIYLTHISTYREECSATARPGQALPINHSTLS